MPPDENNLPDDVATLHGMIKDLRKEAADRRVKLKPYESAFDGYLPEEVDFLLDILGTQDPKAQAVKFRDLAFQMTGYDQEQFLAGLDITPTTPQKETDESQEDEDMALTEERLREILKAEREAERKEAEEAAKARESEQSQAAAIEEIFKEIEALGFERDTPAFRTILALGHADLEAGEEDVDFAKHAPKVKAAFGLDASAEEGAAAAEGSSIPEGGEGTPVGEKGQSADKRFASTAGAGGAGGAPTETAKDWIAEAKEKGISPLEAARQRAEARLYGDGPS